MNQLTTKTVIEASIELFFSDLNRFQNKVNQEAKLSVQEFKKLEKLFARLESDIKHSNLPPEVLEKQKQAFKRDYLKFASASEMQLRVIDWPMGYPGDHLTLENIYKSLPMSPTTFGKYLDWYLFSRTLGIGIRERKNFLSDQLKENLAIHNHPDAKVLNLGCGSCRELYQLGLSLNEFQGTIHCTDFDEEALSFSYQTLASRGIDLDRINFQELNVLKLVSPEFMQKQFGTFDIIYSAGLFDYIKDKGLNKIFRSLYNNLREGGTIIAPFKDAHYYNTFDYHWICNWNAFYQRSQKEVLELLSRSMPMAKIKIMPTKTRSINFFIIQK